MIVTMGVVLVVLGTLLASASAALMSLHYRPTVAGLAAVGISSGIMAGAYGGWLVQQGWPS